MTTPDASPVHPLIVEKQRIDSQLAQLESLRVITERAIVKKLEQAAYMAVMHIV